MFEPSLVDSSREAEEDDLLRAAGSLARKMARATLVDMPGESEASRTLRF